MICSLFVNFVKFAFLLPLSFNCDVVANKDEKKYTCSIVKLVIALKRGGEGGYME